jgi:hypothetical protein
MRLHHTVENFRRQDLRSSAVLDAVAAVTRAVGFRNGFKNIQRYAIRLVATMHGAAFESPSRNGEMACVGCPEKFSFSL